MKPRVIIALQKIVKAFEVKNQDVIVLRGVDLEIYENDFAIVFGPSGCGKSTMLHVILGLEEPTSGDARFFDWNLYAYSEDDRSEFRKKNIGMIYQQPNWIKSLSVVENVAFALSLLGVEKQKAILKAHDCLHIVGLSDWADYYPTELSSGQQQKVALARALVTDPKLIIADEPTGNLDYQSGIELMELFRKLNDAGTSIIMVTHNIDNVDYAKSVIQMFNGRVVRVIETAGKSAAELKQLLLERIILKHEMGISSMKLGKNTKKAHQHNWLKSFLNVFRIRKSIPFLFTNISQILRFLLLLTVYLGKKVSDSILKLRVVPNFVKRRILPGIDAFYLKLIRILETRDKKTISRVDLIDLSLKNMFAKKTRTVITVGGMTIGVAAIVFLISIGYGLEKLVISRVARLEEMRQIDASPAVATNIKLNDEAVASFSNISGVSKVLPVVGLVGKISYQNSNSDVAVYGVMADYLLESAIRPSEGKIFSSNDLGSPITDAEASSKGMVAGASTEHDFKQAVVGEKIGDATYSIHPDEYIRVRSKPTIEGEVLGYTRRVEGVSDAIEYWGGSYPDDPVGLAGLDEDGQELGLWLQGEVLLWDRTTNEEGKTIYAEKKDAEGKQIQEKGYFAELNMKVDRTTNIAQVYGNGSVLGVSTTLAQANTTDLTVTEVATAAASQPASESGFIDISSIDGTNSISETESTKKIELPDTINREAVVNKSLLRILGITENEGVGKKFTVSFIATGELLADGKKIESVPVEYTIVGVTPDTKTPILYVPLQDIKQMGIATYTQAKVVVDAQNVLSQTRKQIELQGFKTTSVVDTVSQIESLFATLRFLLGILGVVALAVAALGMLNTLTVSLLERTHEVGIMKAIGMKSQEVENLYLTESMIMGFMGGVGGLLVGYVAGKATSFALSTFAISKGYGFLDITFIPYAFVILILVISIVVGLLTGIYPAKRATKISALDALRYE
jgi:putative ABC transport system ATP-binding protein